MFFSVITKNLNWRKLTKNYLLLKSGIKGQGWKILILWGFTEKSFFFSLFFWGGGGWRGVHEKPIYSGELPKNVGAWKLADLWELCEKEEGWCFWGGVDTPMHTM